MQSPSPLEGIKALYFEDDSEKVAGIVEFLTNVHKMDIVVVEHPDEAVPLISEERFDVLILDIRIKEGTKSLDGQDIDPRRYGLYFLQQLREGRLDGPTSSAVPVLAFTCVVSTPTVDKLHEIGESSGGKFRYLAKPIESLDEVENALVSLFS